MKKSRSVAALLAALIIAGAAACGGNPSGTEREKDDELVASYIEIAEAYHDSGDIEKAIETLEKAFDETGSHKISRLLSEYIKEQGGDGDSADETDASGNSSEDDEQTDDTDTAEDAEEEPLTAAPDENDDISSESEAGDFYIISGVLFFYLGTDEDVVIPDSVFGIYSEAFADCYSLKSVTIPATVTGMGEDVFRGCTRLSDIYFLGTEEQWYAAVGDLSIPGVTIHFGSLTEPFIPAVNDDLSYFKTWKEYRDANGITDPTYTDIANAVAVVLETAYRLYENGDTDEAYNAARQAYYGYYETSGFERSVMGYISGSAVTDTELQFKSVREIIKKGGTAEDLRTATDELIALVYEQAEKLDELQS